MAISVLESSCHLLYQSNHSKVERQSRLVPCLRTQQANLPAYLHTIPLMLNAKQGSCKSQSLLV